MRGDNDWPIFDGHFKDIDGRLYILLDDFTEYERASLRAIRAYKGEMRRAIRDGIEIGAGLLDSEHDDEIVWEDKAVSLFKKYNCESKEDAE